MLEKLLSGEVQKFIVDHLDSDEHKLLLKHKTIFDLPAIAIIDQIVGKRKAREKLPTYYDTAGIIYPPSTNLEQTSSERTAQFKTTILKLLHLNSYNSMIDLTGGFGVDTFFFSKIFDQVNCVEPTLTLLNIAKHNHEHLGRSNIQYINATAEDYLKEVTYADAMYIDPSRRHQRGGKVFRFAHCEPDITQIQNIILQKSPLLLVKASPLLDIQQGIKELNFVKKVFVVSVYNDCKELLFLCERDFHGEAIIEAVNLGKEVDESFSFTFSSEKNLSAKFRDPLKYLYEPNVAILKAGAFKSVAQKCAVLKIQSNTHLYTSDELIESFPGRIFEIEKLVKPDNKMIREYFPEMKANILVRNYPMTVAGLKKKTGLIEGGEKYLIGFSGRNKKFLVVAHRIA